MLFLYLENSYHTQYVTVVTFVDDTAVQISSSESTYHFRNYIAGPIRKCSKLALESILGGTIHGENTRAPNPVTSENLDSASSDANFPLRQESQRRLLRLRIYSMVRIYTMVRISTYYELGKVSSLNWQMRLEHQTERG